MCPQLTFHFSRTLNQEFDSCLFLSTVRGLFQYGSSIYNLTQTLKEVSEIRHLNLHICKYPECKKLAQLTQKNKPIVITDFREVHCPSLSLGSREFVASILMLEMLILYTEKQVTWLNWFFPCMISEIHHFFHTAWNKTGCLSLGHSLL